MPRKRKVKEAEKENGERWLVTYSDLITLLLVFFIIMYASSNSDTEKMQQALSSIAGAFTGSEFMFDGSEGSIIDLYSENGGGMTNGAIESRNLDVIKQEIESYAEGMDGMDDSIEVVIDEVGLHIRIKDAVLFASGSPNINRESQPVMNKIGTLLKNLPNNYIQVEGHTDNVPMGGNTNIPTNWELGALRAVNVLKNLVSECSLNPKYLSASTNGEYKPVAGNDTVAGRAKNRRVEITILRNYSLEE